MAQTVRSEEWPPASPKDVLRLTPKKNKSNQQLPQSPLRNVTSPSKKSRYQSPDEDDDGESSEDEEILRLKLAKIEARLKLKELEKKKKKMDGKKSEPSKSEVPAPDHDRRTPPPSTHGGRSGKPDVQVPVSPSPRKRLDEKEPPASPSRVLLGIDKGLTGKDISLRRAPGYSITVPPPKPQFTAVAAAALRNATTSSSNSMSTTSSLDNPFKTSRGLSSANDTAQPSTTGGVKTFAQRIAEQRNNLKEKEDRVRSNEKTKTQGWDVPDKKDSAPSKAAPTGVSNNSTSSTSGTSMALARNRTGEGALKTTRAPGVTEQKREAMLKEMGDQSKSSASTSSSQDSGDDSGSFDTFSSFHLSKRLIPHATLSRHLTSKTLFPLPHLLKTVVGPDFDPPGTAGDWVVLGIVCSKSEPRDVARQGAGKYLVTQITDLKWEIELFLFGQAFEKYYRIPKGTVIAILNPGIMKPRVKDTGKFSLTLSDTSDSVLEIGQARDLGYCKALKKDHKECGAWVDKRHTEYCIYHVEQSINKHRSGRMEVATMGKLFSPPKKGQSSRGRKNYFGRGGGGSGRDDGLLPEGPMLDLPQRAGGAGGKVFISTVSTARRIDSDNSQDAFNQGDKAERLRKQLATRERERELKRRLIASQENSTGLDYIRSGMELDGENVRSSQSSAFSAAHIRSIGFDPTRRPGSTSTSSTAKDTSVMDTFRKSTGNYSAADRSLSPVKSSILKRKQQSEGASDAAQSPASMHGPPTKKTRQTDGDFATRESVGWSIKAVREYTSTTLASKRPAGNRSPTRHDFGFAGRNNQVGDIGENQDGNAKKEVKSVKFALMPSGDSDDSDLEIEGWQ